MNRAQIYQAQETARIAADTKQPLAERLRNQLVLQQAIARLQDREAHGAPWYTGFGLNQDSDTLRALWPLYARNNQMLMRDALAEVLHQKLTAFVQLPPASDARAAATQQTYGLLKGYGACDDAVPVCCRERYLPQLPYEGRIEWRYVCCQR